MTAFAPNLKSLCFLSVGPTPDSNLFWRTLSGLPRLEALHLRHVSLDLISPFPASLQRLSPALTHLCLDLSHGYRQVCMTD